jgi:hypothetical protein
LGKQYPLEKDGSRELAEDSTWCSGRRNESYSKERVRIAESFSRKGTGKARQKRLDYNS